MTKNITYPHSRIVIISVITISIVQNKTFCIHFFHHYLCRRHQSQYSNIKYITFSTDMAKSVLGILHRSVHHHSTVLWASLRHSLHLYLHDYCDQKISKNCTCSWLRSICCSATGKFVMNWSENSLCQYVVLWVATPTNARQKKLTPHFKLYLQRPHKSIKGAHLLIIKTQKYQQR